MPFAAPLPARPGHLALFGAGDLLAVAGCPACRYAAEAGRRFLGWFALEGHYDADVLTRLCGSLGFCPAHTRGLILLPGAPGRLAALYRYLLRTALAHLGDGTSPGQPCLACARDAEAGRRALDTVLSGLSEEDLWESYAACGGLCLPHLRAAAARTRRSLVVPMARVLAGRLASRPADVTALAGEPPGDAAIRARLSLSLPSPEAAGPGCPVCLAAGLAERDAVMHASGAVGMPGARRRADEEDRAGAPGEPAGFLCPAHLHQAVAAACERPGRDAVAGMLDWHARLAAAWARALPMRRGRARQASAGLARPCPACRAAARAAAAAAGRLLAGPAGGRAPGSPCLRHVLLLRAADRRGASRYVAEAASAARALAAELETAPAGLMPPWQRAVALTDGRVYGGGPPRPL